MHFSCTGPLDPRRTPKSGLPLALLCAAILAATACEREKRPIGSLGTAAPTHPEGPAKIGGAETIPPPSHTHECVAIRTGRAEDIFPAHWLQPPVSLTATPASASDIRFARQVLGQAMCKYPSSLLCDVLKDVYIVGTLRLYDRPGKATFYNTSIYIRIERIFVLGNAEVAKALDSSENRLEQLFHHELSSLFLRRYPPSVLWERWNAINPGGFVYQSVPVSERQLSSQKLWADGFLIAYCQNTPEDDFNVIAASLFTPVSQLWTAAETSIRIRAKIDLVIAYYQTLDPTLTREYFEQLRVRDGSASASP